MTKIIYHLPSSESNISPFDEAILDIAHNSKVKIVSPYIGLNYLSRLIHTSLDWNLISDIEAWLSSLSRIERMKAWDFITINVSRIHHYPAIHAKTVIGTDKAYLGSSNLTIAGILNRTEIGVAIDDLILVEELNSWFDQLWHLSGPPNLAQGIDLIENLNEVHPATFQQRKKLESEAIAVRAKLAPLVIFENIAEKINPEKFIQREYDFFNVPTSQIDDYFYRILLSLEFENEKPQPESSHLEALTKLTPSNQYFLFNILFENKAIIEASSNSIKKFKLNEDFDWPEAWCEFYKAKNIWDHKSNQLGRKVTLPKKLLIVPDTTPKIPIRNNENLAPTTASDRSVEIFPGEDHPFKSNIEFADIIFSKLCKKLPLSNVNILLKEPQNICHAFIPTYCNDHNLLTEIDFFPDELKPFNRCISLILNGNARDVPHPFNTNFTQDSLLFETLSQKTKSDQWQIYITLDELIDPEMLPKTAKAAELAMLRSYGNIILTQKQIDFLNQRCLLFANQAISRNTGNSHPRASISQRKIPNSIADKIYSTLIEMHISWQGSIIPIQNVDSLFGEISIKTNIKFEIISDILRRHVENVPKVFYLDIGIIQKNLIFTFLNNTLSIQDWELIPLTKDALSRIGNMKYLQLIENSAQIKT